MATLGDVIHNVSSFFSLKRTTKAPARGMTNPVTSDPPPAGRYHNWYAWDDERKAYILLNTSWPFSGMHKIGMATLSSQLLIKRRQGEEVEDLKNHLIERLVDNPNPDMSREYLWMDTIYNMYLKASFWFLYPDSRGNIAEIWPMPFSRVQPVPNEAPNPDSLFSGYIYTFQNGKEQTIPASNVVYLRFPHPLDRYSAWPPTRAVLQPTILDRAQSEWNTNMFDKNKGLPASIVSVPPELSNDQFNRVKAELREHVGERMVTRAGAISVEFAQESHKEMEFLSGREFNKAEIYEALGVPLDPSDKEAWRWFLNNTVWPVLQIIAGQLTTQLVRPYFGPDIFAEFEDIRPQDRSMEVQESVQYSPFRSYNEERATRGEKALKKIVIPDEVPGFGGLSLYDDVPSKLVDSLLPVILKEKEKEQPQQGGFSGIPSMAGSAGAAHEADQEEREAGDTDAIEEANEGDEPEEAPEAKGWQIPAGMPGDLFFYRGPEFEQGISWTGHVPHTEYVPAQARMESQFKAWQDIAVKKLNRGKSPAHVYLGDMVSEHESYTLATVLGHCRSEAEVKAVFSHFDEYLDIKATIGNRDEVPPEQLALEEELIPQIEKWLTDQSKRIAAATGPNGEAPATTFWSAEIKAMTAFLVPFVSKWAEQGISSTVIALSEMGLGLDAGVNARAAQWAGEHALELARGLTDTTKELAKAKIKQWLLTGKPMGELEKSLAEVISPRWRASLIASTEVTRAFAEASLEIAQEMDVIKRVVWLTAHDEQVCPICGPLNGSTTKVGSVFPGGFSSPPAHPRCRCGLSFSV